MYQLQRNLAGQRLFFQALDAAGAVVPGITWNAYWYKDASGAVASAGAFTEHGGGLYSYQPSQGETDCLSFCLDAQVAAGPAFHDLVLPGSTFTNAGGDVTLGAAQPHYAPAKPGDLMGIAPNQDVRNIVGSVAGDLLGSVLGQVPSPATLSPGACDALLDRVNGVQTGLTLRVALRNIVAALVNVEVDFALSQHSGPTSSKIAAKFPPKARQLLGQASIDLLKAIEFNTDNAELGLLAPNLVSACQQLAVALDAVRTASA